MLLDAGADINGRSGFFGNALNAAVYCCNKAVTRLLLDRGADVNATDGLHGNALQAAAVGQAHLALLQDTGISSTDGPLGDELESATVESFETIIQLLVDRGAVRTEPLSVDHTELQ